jgi:hypothetical protein
MIKENGLVPQDRPIRTPSVAVLFADPASGTRARKLLENIMCRRLERVLASVDPGTLLPPSYRDYPDRVTARMYPFDQAECCSSCTSIVIGVIPQSDWDVVSLGRDGLSDWQTLSVKKSDAGSRLVLC